MELDTKQRLGLAVGALIGAVLGAGSAFLCPGRLRGI
jgi:hypothetical protein